MNSVMSNVMNTVMSNVMIFIYDHRFLSICWTSSHLNSPLAPDHRTPRNRPSAPFADPNHHDQPWPTTTNHCRTRRRCVCFGRFRVKLFSFELNITVMSSVVSDFPLAWLHNDVWLTKALCRHFLEEIRRSSELLEVLALRFAGNF